jgi:hypothetical protein
MASGQDPLADMQNLMGYAGLVGPNPYLTYQGKIPMPGYVGSPTTAWGTTINSVPPAMGGGGASQASPALQAPAPAGQSYQVGSDFGSAQGPVNELLANYAAAQSKLTPQQQLIQQQNAAIRNRNLTNLNTMNIGRAGQGGFGNPDSAGDVINAGRVGIPPMPNVASGAPATAAPTAPGAGGLSRDQYLSMLANPGPLPQYGAAGPQPGQTPTGTPLPNVTGAFLAANKGSSTPYLNTLRNLQGGTA